MKTCPQIIIKQYIYSKNLFGHPIISGKIWNSIEIWILFYVYKCLYTVYKFHIVISVYKIQKMCTSRQLCSLMAISYALEPWHSCTKVTDINL